MADLSGVFILISDLWPNFKTPESTAGLKIWKKNLKFHDEQTIMKAIEELYKTEHFFSFSKLIELLGDLTKPTMMSMGEATDRVMKLARNIHSDLTKEDDIVRETIRQAGGIRFIAHSEEAEEWKLKKIQSAYRNACEIVEKREMHRLDAPIQKRLTNE